jgi:hypothetical protein
MRRFLVIILALVSPVLADSTNAPINLTGLTIHRGDRPAVEATGEICSTNGILEFVAVEAKGRDYESLLTLNCRPSQLQFALLLIGCETGDTHRVALDVEWTAGSKTQRAPVEQWLVDRKTGKPPKDLDWAFTGSCFGQDFEGRRIFLADEEQAFIALWPQSSMVINLVGEHGNPYRSEHQGFEINSAAVPPLGTKVKLLIRQRSQ